MKTNEKKCQCGICKTTTLLNHNQEEYVRAKHNSQFYKFLKKIGLFRIPEPPFRIGDKVKYIYELDGVYDCHKGEIYSIYSQFLSNNKKYWFIRLNEKPSSAPAEYFELVNQP